MSLSGFLVRRITYSIFVLLGLSMVIFIIARIMPGDPARMAVGARAPQWVVDRIRENMHLNEPVPVQYFYWLRDALKGDFGLSLVTQRPVTNDVREFLPASLELALLAAIISSIVGIGLGILSARYKDTWIDNVVRVFSYAGIVTPSFVFAILFVFVGIQVLALGLIGEYIGRIYLEVRCRPRYVVQTIYDHAADVPSRSETHGSASSRHA